MNQQKDKTSEKCSTNKRPVAAHEIIATNFKQKPPILTRGVLPAAGGMILAGDSGVGKSLMRLEWSILLASGLAIYDLASPSSQCVLVFQVENTIASEQFRMKRMLYGLDIKSAPQQFYYAPPVYPANIQKEKYMNYVLDCIHQVRATVVFFDPLISYHTENENDNVKMRTVLDAFTHVTKESGAAVILIHHFGKPSETMRGNDYRIRGAQAIRDWADTAIAITAVKNLDTDNHAYRRLEFIKIREGPYHPPLMLKRDENFLCTITEDVEESPSAALLALVYRSGKSIHGKKELEIKLQEICRCTAQIARLTIKESLESGGVVQTITDGTPGFEVLENLE